MWADWNVRPPILDEMMPDIERVIATVAHHYSDSTTPHLQFDELVGDGRLKLSELITKGELDRQTCRVNFFKFFKTAVNNQARSKVQKYRFTEKRTGVKPPPREERFKAPVVPVPGAEEQEEHPPAPEYHKNVELSLDDPDLNLQVPDGEHAGEREGRDVAEEYESLLFGVEKNVFRQLTKPSEEACCYALEDAYRKRTGEKLTIKVKWEHMARAERMDLKAFEKTVLSIRRTISSYRMMTDEQQDTEARRNARIATLKVVFGLQIPPGLDDMVVRRLFTMAARDQYDEHVKNKPDVVQMLLDVGAKPPRMLGDKMACYGVLYQKNCRKCNTCDLRHSCAVEAANMGLTHMAMSPRLLGGKQQRIPAFLPKSEGEVDRVSSTDEAEIAAYLEETFERYEKDGEVFYCHRIGSTNKRRLLFCIEQVTPLKLRFCNPMDSLKARLVNKQKVWCAPEDASMSELIALIEQHAKETFE